MLGTSTDTGMRSAHRLGADVLTEDRDMGQRNQSGHLGWRELCGPGETKPVKPNHGERSEGAFRQVSDRSPGRFAVCKVDI